MKTPSADPYDVLVIGGGHGGLTAAHQAALRGYRVASLDDGWHMGGLVINVGRLDDYPALGPIAGVEMAATQLEALMALKVDIVQESVTGLEVDGDIKVVTTDSGVYTAKSVVLASGARLKSLGVVGEQALFGRGVSQCADCDAGFFVDQQVVVVGGGDSALQEALHLCDYVSGITLVTRGRELRAKRAYIEQATANAKIELRHSTQVAEILGSDGVEGVRLALSGGASEVLACSGVFIFVGLEPNTGYLPQSLLRDENGYLVTDACLRTKLPGIYALGAVRAGYSGQLSQAAEEAQRAVAQIAGTRS